MGLGASDAVHIDAREQLALVVKRELEHVSDRRNFSHLRRALKEAEERCNLLLQGSQSAIAYVHEGMHIHANDQYLELFGYASVDEVCGVSLVDILDPSSAGELKAAFKQMRAPDAPRKLDLEIASYADAPEGQFKAVMQLAHAQYEGEECLQIEVKVSGDATDNTPATPAVEEVGINAFVKSAERFFGTSEDFGFILTAQVDHLSSLQTIHGVAGTDAICKHVWQKIQATADEYPTVRLSASQYAIAVIVDSQEKLEEEANRIRLAVEGSTLEVRARQVEPTVTVCGAMFDNAKGCSATLDQAFKHLTETADGTTGNTVELPNVFASSSELIDDAKVVLRQITEAIEKKRFIILFQPIISLRGDSDEHYEVFLRMTDPEGAEIEPGKFLQTAIDNNVAGKIDRWVILQAIKTLGLHRAKGNTTRLTINLTANSISDPDFVDWLSVAIKAARLPTDAVIFQVTQSDAARNIKQTREFLESLRGMHCRTSLSRFGTTPDSFEVLRHLPVELVKLDGIRMLELGEDKSIQDEVIDQIKQLQNEGKLTIVPMVENASTLSVLWQAGANYIQGHYLQEPTSEMSYDFSTED